MINVPEFLAMVKYSAINWQYVYGLKMVVVCELAIIVIALSFPLERCTHTGCPKRKFRFVRR